MTAELDVFVKSRLEGEVVEAVFIHLHRAKYLLLSLIGISVDSGSDQRLNVSPMRRKCLLIALIELTIGEILKLHRVLLPAHILELERVL